MEVMIRNGAACQTIDGCQHTFEKLASRVLPEYMQKMRRAIEKPWSLSMFDVPGIGRKQLMEAIGLENDFSGCYVFLAPEPVYVGISGTVMRRVSYHVRGKTHYEATLAYKMATDTETGSILSRNEKMKDQKFMEKFHKSRKKIGSWDVAWVEIPNPLELYLFEVYCSMQLNTFRWNTFKTH